MGLPSIFPGFSKNSALVLVAGVEFFFAIGLRGFKFFQGLQGTNETGQSAFLGTPCYFAISHLTLAPHQFAHTVTTKLRPGELMPDANGR